VVGDDDDPPAGEAGCVSLFAKANFNSKKNEWNKKLSDELMMLEIDNFLKVSI